MQLVNKTALITGSGSLGGIGAAIAQTFAAEGASVIVAGRNLQRGEDVVAHLTDLGGRARFLHVDMTNLDSVAALAQDAGDIDILVNNAGYAPLGPSTSLTTDEFDRGFNTNVRGPYFLTAAIVRGMMAREKGGNIITISSLAAQRAQPMMSAYGATKGALESLNQSWAVEFAPFGIRANAISPGTISSDNVMIMLGDATKQIVYATPLERVGTPDEIAKVALFLASEQSSFMTGALVKVDGGLTIR